MQNFHRMASDGFLYDWKRRLKKTNITKFKLLTKDEIFEKQLILKYKT